MLVWDDCARVRVSPRVRPSAAAQAHAAPTCGGQGAGLSLLQQPATYSSLSLQAPRAAAGLSLQHVCLSGSSTSTSCREEGVQVRRAFGVGYLCGSLTSHGSESTAATSSSWSRYMASLQQQTQQAYVGQGPPLYMFSSRAPTAVTPPSAPAILGQARSFTLASGFSNFCYGSSVLASAAQALPLRTTGLPSALYLPVQEFKQADSSMWDQPARQRLAGSTLVHNWTVPGSAGGAGSTHPVVQRVMQAAGSSRLVPCPLAFAANPHGAASAAASASISTTVAAAGCPSAAQLQLATSGAVWQQLQDMASLGGGQQQLLQQVWSRITRSKAARMVFRESVQQQVQTWCEEALVREQKEADALARWERLAQGLRRRRMYSYVAEGLQDAWAQAKLAADAAAASAVKAADSAARAAALQRQLQEIRAAGAVRRWGQLVQGMRRRRFHIYMAAALRRRGAKARKAAAAAAEATAQVDTLQQQLQQLQALAHTQAGQLQQAAQVQGQLRQQVGGLQQHAGALQQQMGVLQQQLGNAQRNAAGWEAQYKRVDAELDDVTSDMSQLVTDKAAAEQQVADLQQQLAYKDKLLADLPDHLEWQRAQGSINSSKSGSSSSSSCRESKTSTSDGHHGSVKTSSSSSSAARRLSLDVVSTATSTLDATSPRKARTPGKPGQESAADSSSNGSLENISEVVGSPEGSAKAACSPNSCISSTTLTSSSSGVSLCSSVPSAQEQDSTSAPAVPQLQLQEGSDGIQYNINGTWQQLCGQFSSEGTGSSKVLTPGSLTGVAAQCGELQEEQLLGEGGEGRVYALPGAEVLVPLVDQPGAEYRLPAAVKIVVLEGDEAKVNFIQEAHRVAAVAGELSHVLPILAAWVQEGVAPGTGNSATLGVLLMPQLQRTLLEVADSLIAQQQQEQEQQQQQGSTFSSHRERVSWALKVLEMGLGMQTQGWQHRDWKAVNVMQDSRGRMWLVDCGHAFRLSQQQQQLSELEQDTPLTSDNSCPEQLQVGTSRTIVGNDTFALGATGLEVVLGKEGYQELQVVSKAPWLMGSLSCLFPPQDAQLQQHQIVRLEGALWRWLKAAGATQDRQLLKVLALLVGMVQPVPERRLTAASAQAQLQKIMSQQ